MTRTSTAMRFKFEHIPTGNIFTGTIAECCKKWGYGASTLHYEVKKGLIAKEYIETVDVDNDPKGRDYWYWKAILELGV